MECELAIAAIGVLAPLMLLQSLIVDVVGLWSGHEPVANITTDHTNPHSRAARTVVNTNESVGNFVIGVRGYLV